MEYVHWVCGVYMYVCICIMFVYVHVCGWVGECDVWNKCVCACICM